MKRFMKWKGIPYLIIACLLVACIFMAGYEYHQPVVEIVEEIQTTVFRYPNTPPYEAFPDPIDFDQSLVLLYGMRASHEQALNWTFESDPGFGIADRDLQEQFIKWYDQLIDILWRMKEGSK